MELPLPLNRPAIHARLLHAWAPPSRRYGEIFAVRSNVRNWPDPEIADRQVRSELTDRYLVDTDQSSAIGRCILNE